MASRNQRRRRAGQSTYAEARKDVPSGLGVRMLTAVSKTAESRQLNKPDDDGFVTLYDADRAIRPPLPPDKLLVLYEENATHSAAINAQVADSVGRGWELREEDEDEEGADGAEQEQVERLLRDQLAESSRPSGFSFGQIVKAATRNLRAIGWGCIEVARDGDKLALFPMPAHTVRRVKGDDGLYVQIKGDKRAYFKSFGDERSWSAETGKEGAKSPEDEANELIWFADYSDRSPYYGVPEWVSAVSAIAELTAIREYNVAWFESGGTGDKVLHVKAKDQAVAAEIADSLEEQMKNAKGYGHSSFITEGTEDTEVVAIPLSKNEGQRDGQFRNRRAELVVEVLIAHQTPPYRVGWAVLGSLNGDAADEMIDTYRYGVVEPLQEVVEGRLNETLFGPQGFQMPGWRFEFADRDWSQFASEVESAAKAVDAGLMTPNEGTEYIGYDKSDDPDMDLHYIAGQRIEGRDRGLQFDENGQPMQPPEQVDAESAVGVLKELERALSQIVAIEKERLQTASADTHTGSDESRDARVEEPDAIEDDPQPGVRKTWLRWWRVT